MEIISSTKICDGLYVGDQIAAKDLDTIVINHITHIINCCSHIVPNHFQDYKIKYLCFTWNQSENQIIFDKNEKILNQITMFLEEAKQLGQSCLIHTHHGHNISFTILSGYFMKKYKWSLYKTLQYLDSRLQKIQLKANYFKQLKNLQLRLIQKYDNLTNDWQSKPQCMEELIMRNTYLNSIKLDNAQLNINNRQNSKQRGKLKWNDQINIKFNDASQQRKNTKSILKKNQDQRSKLKEKLEKLQQIKYRQIKNLQSIQGKLQQNTSISSYIKQKLINSKNRKIIHLYSSSDPISDPQNQQNLKKQPVQQLKIKVQCNNYIQNSPVLKNEQNKKANDEKRNIKSEMSDKQISLKCTQKKKQPFVIMFKNQTDRQISQIKENSYKSSIIQKNKKKTKLNISTINKQKYQRFETEVTDTPDVKNKQQSKIAIKKLILQKTKIPSKQKQNSQRKSASNQKQYLYKFQTDQNFKQKFSQKSTISFKTQNSTILNDQNKRKNNQHESFKSKVNNYIDDNNNTSKKSSVSSKQKSTRGISPPIHQNNKINIQKLKGSIKIKTQHRGISPANGAQISVGLKQATNIINNAFTTSSSIYKPKWKF